MKAIKPNKATDKLARELVENVLLRFTIQLFRNTDNGFRPFGSGVLTLIHKTHFILTASHVAEYLVKDENKLFIRIGKTKFINVLGHIKYTDIKNSKGVDLAYIKLDVRLAKVLARSYKFLTTDKLRNHNHYFDGINYCILGFPESNVKFESDVLDTGATYYLTSAANENPYQYYKYEKSDAYIVNMKGKGINMLKNIKQKVNTNFYGISGCGLWYLKFNQDPNTNEYWLDYRLIGIMTEFRKGKYFCLIAYKIHLFIDAFRAIEGFSFREIAVDP